MTSTAKQLSSGNRLPKQIGRFIPIRQLGHGAQGVVYLAKDSKLDRQVAIKTLSQKRNDSNLAQEARNVSNLHHDNIVQLYEIGTHENVPFLVYQYFEGDQLRKRMDDGNPFQSLTAVKIICKILDGINYAHSKNIVHRDINPSNVLINNDDNPKVMDFGISQEIGTATSTDAIAGTVNYLAPELLSGQSLGPSVDIFSTGLILHEMLTGRMVFTAENHMAVMYKISHENILPPSKFNNNIDVELDRLVMRALEKDINKRYKSADEMKQELQEYLKSFDDENEKAATPEANKKINSTLEFLMRRMQRKQDFPAISSHISEINQKASKNALSSANELSNVILKDFALTTKLLRLVNASYYGQFGGEITTVSRAIIILGFEQVRAVALSIILFEHLKSDQQANELKMGIYSALMSAIIAREQAKNMKLKNEDTIETVFIASMFHELGNLLTIYYFPEEYQEIVNLIVNKGLEEKKAVKKVLGLLYSELGKGIASEWKLPDVISNSMDKLPEGKIKKTEQEYELVRQLTCFSNELSAIGKIKGNKDDALKKLLDRYKNCIGVDKDKIEKLIDDSKKEIKEFTRILQIDTTNIELFADLSTTNSPADAMGNTGGINGADEVPSHLQTNVHLEGEIEQANARQDILINGISEITNSMLGDYDLNSVLTMVLETIYRGMGFSRVLFCLRDNKNSTLVGRFGYGKTITELIPKFKCPLGKGNDVINETVSKGKDFVILDVNSAEYKNRIPDWLRKLTAPRSLLLYPVIVNKRVLGVIYADMDDGTTQVSMEALRFFKTLRNQAALAIMQKQMK